ncbi:hypothetical protein J6590_017187 [Homalodisca vitripennis]|nr:hypothetical protein J6590_017187 [Homalodisca vitripennis]
MKSQQLIPDKPAPICTPEKIAVPPEDCQESVRGSLQIMGVTSPCQSLEDEACKNAAGKLPGNNSPRGFLDIHLKCCVVIHIAREYCRPATSHTVTQYGITYKLTFEATPSEPNTAKSAALSNDYRKADSRQDMSRTSWYCYRPSEQSAISRRCGCATRFPTIDPSRSFQCHENVRKTDETRSH